MRAHCPVLRDAKQVGELTSGSFSPTLGTSIGMAYGHRVGGFVDPVPGWPEYGKLMALHGIALIPLLWARYAAR